MPVASSAMSELGSSTPRGPWALAPRTGPSLIGGRTPTVIDEERMGAAVTIMLIKERQVVDAFLRAGATSATTAVHPDELSVDLGGVGGRRLVRGAVLREAGDGRYYLDLLGWEALRRHRRRVLFVILLLIALVALVLAGQFPPGRPL
jgi:hypothetical protein